MRQRQLVKSASDVSRARRHRAAACRRLRLPFCESARPHSCWLPSNEIRAPSIFPTRVSGVSRCAREERRRTSRLAPCTATVVIGPPPLRVITTASWRRESSHWSSWTSDERIISQLSAANYPISRSRNQGAYSAREMRSVTFNLFATMQFVKAKSAPGPVGAANLTFQ